MSDQPEPRERPLSPFMIGPYYRAQLTSMLSITHRITGVALALGAALLVAWLMAAAAGPAAYARFSECVSAWCGQLLLLGWSWALLFHFCNGIRHLFWDTGRGFELKTVYASGYAVLLVSFLLTAAVWAVAYL